MRSVPLLADALLDCAFAGAAVIAAAGVALAGGYAAVPAVAIPLYAGVCTFILLLLKDHGKQHRFGWANRVTLARAGIVALLAGFALDGARLGAGGRLALSLAALAALVLDGVDGRLARRGGTASAFGARFDMEVDALTVLVLSVLVWRTGQAGGWAVFLGAARYAFVTAGTIFPVLAGELAPSRRRKTICGVTVASLVAALLPAVPPALAGGLCAAAGLLLIYSFGMDCILLVRGVPIGSRRAPPLT
jgi:phosphatidylglycerophosphate synthase